MTKRVELPGGGWAEIAEPEELSIRHRQFLREYLVAAAGMREKLLKLGAKADSPESWGDGADELSSAELKKIDALQGAFICVYVRGWSRGELPDMDTVYDLPGPIFDKLAEITAMGDGAVDTGISADPASPTGPSGGSRTSARANSSTRSPRKSKSSGASTSTGGSSPA